MVRFAFLILGAALGAACTPEAIVVDPEAAGSAGAPSAGSNGSAGEPSGSAGEASGGSPSGAGGESARAGEANAPGCAELTSPRSGCVECLAAECAAEVAACEGTACLCNEWGDATGQMNCMLACPTLEPAMAKANACAEQCGFQGLGQSDPGTHALFDCAVNAPGGPPNCPSCFPPPSQQ
jgi:hypothetical protein